MKPQDVTIKDFRNIRKCNHSHKGGRLRWVSFYLHCGQGLQAPHTQVTLGLLESRSRDECCLVPSQRLVRCRWEFCVSSQPGVIWSGYHIYNFIGNCTRSSIVEFHRWLFNFIISSISFIMVYRGEALLPEYLLSTKIFLESDSKWNKWLLISLTTNSTRCRRYNYKEFSMFTIVYFNFSFM